MSWYTAIAKPRLLGRLGLFLVAALLLWANWQAPNLHDYPAAVSVAALRVQGGQPGRPAAALHAQLVQMAGITACTVSADGCSVAFTYHPDEVTPAEVRQRVARSFRVQEYVAPAAPVAGPQCPVPQRYVVALEQLRFALNLRRLFVKV